MTTPSTDDRSLLIIGIKGYAVAVERETGAERWRVKLEESWEGSPVELLVSGGVVYATGSSREVYWLDYATGAQLRHVATTAASGRATLLLDGSSLFVTRAGSVDCFSLDGVKRWHNELQGLGHGAIAMGFPDNIRQGDKDSR